MPETEIKEKETPSAVFSFLYFQKVGGGAAHKNKWLHGKTKAFGYKLKMISGAREDMKDG